MEFKTTEDKVCYGIGNQIGDQLKTSQFPDFNLEAVLAGIQDSLAGKLALSQNEIMEAFNELNARFAKEQESLSAEAAEKSAAYLAENAKKEGVIVTESGLQYEVLSEGNGANPGPESVVSVHYHGSLVDGTVFDSSVQRGQPVEFGVNQVIKGWVEGLQLMNEGAKYKLTIPAELAYGDQGAGTIPPKSALVFEVELLKIVK